MLKLSILLAAMVLLAPRVSSQVPAAAGPSSDAVTHDNGSVVLPPKIRSQIANSALQKAREVDPVAWEAFRAGFNQFAPPTWTAAVNNISVRTVRCMVKVSTRVALRSQYLAGMSSPNASIFSMVNQTFLWERMKANCQPGIYSVIALAEAINSTYQQLPEHVKQVLQSMTTQMTQLQAGMDGSAGNVSDAARVALIDILQQLKSITPAERQNMSVLFPQLGPIFLDPRIDQLLDMYIQVVNISSRCPDWGSANSTECKNAMVLSQNATDLMQDIFMSALMPSMASGAHGSLMADVPVPHAGPGPVMMHDDASVDGGVGVPPKFQKLPPASGSAAADGPLVIAGPDPKQQMIVYTSHDEPLHLAPMAKATGGGAANGVAPST